MSYLNIAQAMSNHKQKRPSFALLSAMIIVTSIVTTVLTLFVTRPVLNTFAVNKLQSESQIKLTIQRQSQFDGLVEYFGDLHAASTSCVYLIQPKDYIKLYMEQVSIHNNTDNPVRLPFKIDVDDNKLTFLDIERNGYCKMTKTSGHIFSDKLTELSVCYVLPIYEYRAIVAEVYLFYDTDPQFDNDKLRRMDCDYQVISRLIK